MTTAGLVMAEPTAESKLALLELLSECDDVGMCARAALDWLGLVDSCVAALELDGSRLVVLAVSGANLPAPGEVLAEIESRDHALVRAMVMPLSSVVHGASLGKAYASLGAFTVIPLVGDTPGNEAAEPSGVLLVPVDAPSARARPIGWVARHLGRRIGQVRAMRRLLASQRKLSRERALVFSIINAVGDPILLTDTEGRLLLANNRAEAFFASVENESEGRQRAVSLNNMLFSAALAQRAAAESGLARRELTLVDPSDGSDRLFELLSTQTNDLSEGTGIVSVLRNVTDLQRATEEIERNYRTIRVAEAEVRAERDRLDLIIDSVADPILVTDPGGAIAMMNAPAERLFTANAEAPREQVSRVRANDAHFSSFVANLFFASQSLRWKGDIGLVDAVNGENMPVEAIAGKILGEDGAVSHVVTILHDRREALENARLYQKLKEASEELEQKVRTATEELMHQNELLRRQAIALEQASQLKSQFLANMPHEFRTPLNAILGYTSMLLEGLSGELSPAQKRSLSRVDSNGKHLVAIINDILDISRIEAGKMPLHVGEFRFDDLIAEVVSEVEPVIASRPFVRVSTAVQRIPRMRTDRAKLKQIVLNLLINALKFTPKGRVKVMAVHDAPARTVSVSVSDTGIGIAEKDQALVFEDFRQVDDSPTREYGGTGLGLSICRRLATMLGGKITLRSKVGQGSMFTLTIPRRLRR